jgi:hypothetical protein
MNVTLDGIHAANPTLQSQHPPEGEHLAAKAAAINEP